MKVRKPKMTKWKIYATLVAIITAGTLAFTALTAYVTYPTAEHRRVGQELSKLDAKAYSLNEDYAKVAESKEYRELIESQESTYTIRMGIGSGILSMVLSVAVIVAVYRYLRRNRITNRPVRATVFIDMATTALTVLPTLYIGEAITGIKTDSMAMVMLLVSLPFVIGFSALITLLIAKIAEWHYNRSHGFIEE